MYELRSGITHGSDLMQLDQYVVFGWDPPGGMNANCIESFGA
jgi:hypothetical protein